MILPVIIPTRGRLNLLRQTVDSLEATTKIPFHLYLVDDNSDDETQTYLTELSARSNCTVILNKETHGSGYGRNQGVYLAYLGVPDHEFLYHSDGDIFFLPNWYENLFKAMELMPNLGVVGGRKHPHHGTLDRVNLDGFSVVTSDQQVGMSMLIRRKAFDAIGGKFYENTPQEMGGEDTTLCNAMREKDWIIGSIDPATVLHCGLTNSLGQQCAGYPDELKQPFPEGVIYG